MSEKRCRRVTSAALTGLLPKPLIHTLTNSIPRMLRDLGYIDHDSVIVYGAETRSSSPVRIVRNRETRLSTNINGLYPCGEGSGYAGGIVSSAVDGIRTAEAVLKQMKDS